MGKRSNFDRIEKDYYRTIDPKATIKLLPHLSPGCRFIEPCCGDYILVDQLEYHGLDCVGAYDIDQADATSHQYENKADYFITNPPWSRHLLHPIILNLSQQLPTWLLFDADWAHTKQSKSFQTHLKKIVSVGRLKWIENTKMTGKDNCCWYLFDGNYQGVTEFVN